MPAPPIINPERFWILLNMERQTEKAFDHFNRLITSGQTELERWQIKSRAKELFGSDYGLVDKSERSKSLYGDIKYYFHYHPQAVPLLRQAGADLQTHSPLLTTCEHIYNRCMTAAVDTCRALDALVPGFSFAKLIQPELSILRVLYYLGGKANGYAKIHIDQGGLTFHLDESRPALMLLGQNNVHRCISGAALVFAGAKMQLLTRCKIKASPHYATEPDLTYQGIRNAAVFFLHLDPGFDQRIVKQFVKAQSMHYARKLRQQRF